MHPWRTQLLGITLALLAIVTTAGADEKRYIVSSRNVLGDMRVEYPLWRDGQAADACAQARLSKLRGGRDHEREFCVDGVMGIKPVVGTLRVGDEVERLETGACGRRLVPVRVLIGTLQGDIGCVEGEALSSVKP